MSVYENGCFIISKLKEAGYIAYFAGGWVRDFLMNTPSDDIDIATNASVEFIQEFFPKTIPVGINFGIVVVVEGDHQFEVATFRKDQGYRDGRRPTGIELSTPEEDALRRDFTINGMFYDPLEEKLYDFVGGQKDIREGIIRAIGNPHERFLEDRLRMIRAVRYASRFNFPMDNETMEAIIHHSSDLFPAVAIERIWQEFVKMAKFAHFDISLITLHRLNLLQTIFLELKGLPVEEVQSRLRYIPLFPKQAPLITRILELFPNFEIKDKLNLCEYLKISNEDRNFVIFLSDVSQITEKISEDYELAKIYADPRAPTSLGIISSKLSKEKSKEFTAFHDDKMTDLSDAIYRIRDKKPILTSFHLKEEGIKPGKEMGTLLKEAERLAINERISDPKTLITRLKDSSHWKM